MNRSEIKFPFDWCVICHRFTVAIVRTRTKQVGIVCSLLTCESTEQKFRLWFLGEAEIPFPMMCHTCGTALVWKGNSATANQATIRHLSVTPLYLVISLTSICVKIPKTFLVRPSFCANDLSGSDLPSSENLWKPWKTGSHTGPQ